MHDLNGAVTDGLGDWSSVAGLVVTVVGFLITVRMVRRSRSAAVAAEGAAVATRDSIKHMDTVADLSAAIAAMSEIVILQRRNAWELIYERYACLRRALVTVQTGGAFLRQDQETALQSAILMCSAGQAAMEEKLAGRTSGFDVCQSNKVLSREMDRLQKILIELKTQEAKPGYEAK